MRFHFAESIQLEKCSRILEVGCGSGAVLADWPRQESPLPEAKTPTCIGLDFDSHYLALARKIQPTLDWVCGDGLSLPFPTGVFDLTYCHYFLLWIHDPKAALAEMVRVTRHGGWVAAFAEPDYGGRIDYPSQLSILGEYQTQSLQEQGANPFLGRQLRALFLNSGLINTYVGVLAGEWTVADDPTQSLLEWEVIMADIEATLASEELNRWKKTAQAAWMSKERITFIPTFYAWGQKPLKM